MSLFKRKKSDWDFAEIPKDSVAMQAEPWYPPTPTTVVVGLDHGTVHFHVKETIESLLGRIRQTMKMTDDTDFLIRLEVDDYQATHVWVHLNRIAAIQENKQRPEAND